MGSAAFFSAGFNSLFATHESVSSGNDKSMIYKNNYTKNEQYINGSGEYFGPFSMQIVSILGLINFL
jgi:hypothetical protein